MEWSAFAGLLVPTGLAGIFVTALLGEVRKRPHIEVEATRGQDEPRRVDYMIRIENRRDAPLPIKRYHLRSPATAKLWWRVPIIVVGVPESFADMKTTWEVDERLPPYLPSSTSWPCTTLRGMTFPIEADTSHITIEVEMTWRSFWMPRNTRRIRLPITDR